MTTSYERRTVATAGDVIALLKEDDYIPKYVVIIGTGPNPLEGHLFKGVWPACKVRGVEACKDQCEKANRLFYTIHAAVVEHPNLDVTLYRRCGMLIASSIFLRPGGKNYRVRVPAITLNSLAENMELIGSSVFLWMDCEGSELNALRGGSKLLDSVKWIHLEVTPVPNREGWPSAEDIHTWMERNSYELVCSHVRRGRPQERHDRTYRKRDQ